MKAQADSNQRKEAGDWLLPHFPRLRDLFEHSDWGDPKNYFNVELPSALIEEERRFTKLDSSAWEVLRGKAAPYVSIADPQRNYQQLWNTLDEARGYIFLAEQGYDRIEFIQIENRKSGSKRLPDLVGYKLGSTAVLEVKTINESRDSLAEDAPWRNEAITVPQCLSEELTRKISTTIQDAKIQLESYPHPTDRKIVFLVVRFDHGQKTGWHLYSELKNFIASQAKDGIEVFYEPML